MMTNADLGFLRGPARALAVPGLALAALILFSPLVHADDSGTPVGTSTAAAGCNPGSENESFWQRLADSYKAHLFPKESRAGWHRNRGAPGHGFESAAAASIDAGGYRRGLSPPPESVPPWPYSTWPMGGTPAIGYENIYYGPLMDAIWCGKNGKQWKDSRFTIYGWLEPGANISTSRSHFNKLHRYRRQLSRRPIPTSRTRFSWISSRCISSVPRMRSRRITSTGASASPRCTGRITSTRSRTGS